MYPLYTMDYNKTTKKKNKESNDYKRLIFVTINRQKLGSKESSGVKFNDDISAELCLSSGLKAAGIFVILLRQDGFESSYSEIMVQTSTY